MSYLFLVFLFSLSPTPLYFPSIIATSLPIYSTACFLAHFFYLYSLFYNSLHLAFIHNSLNSLFITSQFITSFCITSQVVSIYSTAGFLALIPHLFARLYFFLCTIHFSSIYTGLRHSIFNPLHSPSLPCTRHQYIPRVSSFALIYVQVHIDISAVNSPRRDGQKSKLRRETHSVFRDGRGRSKFCNWTTRVKGGNLYSRDLQVPPTSSSLRGFPLQTVRS